MLRGPTREVLCPEIVSCLVSTQSLYTGAELSKLLEAYNRLAKSTRFLGRLPVSYHFYPSTRFLTLLPIFGILISKTILLYFYR